MLTRPFFSIVFVSIFTASLLADPAPFPQGNRMFRPHLRSSAHVRIAPPPSLM